jgi:hypothetical protein
MQSNSAEDRIMGCILGGALIQNLNLAQQEYINAFGTNSWRETVRPL